MAAADVQSHRQPTMEILQLLDDLRARPRRAERLGEHGCRVQLSLPHRPPAEMDVGVGDTIVKFARGGDDYYGVEH